MKTTHERTNTFAAWRLLALGAAAFALPFAVPQSGQAQQSNQQQQQMSPSQNSGQSTTGQSDTGRNTGTMGGSGTQNQMGTTGAQGSQSGMSAGQGMDMMAADGKKLIGKDVYGANNQKIGEVDDVVLDQSSSKVNAILVDVGGFLGIGAKTVAVPVADIRAEGDRVVASSMTKEQAKDMPEYKKDDRATNKDSRS